MDWDCCSVFCCSAEFFFRHCSRLRKCPLVDLSREIAFSWSVISRRNAFISSCFASAAIARMCRSRCCCQQQTNQKSYRISNTHPFNGPLSWTTRVGRYQKRKTNLYFTGARDSGTSWAICKSAPRSRQITTPVFHHSVFTARMPFLPPNQQALVIISISK